MKSIKESLLTALNEGRFTKANLRKATEIADKFLTKVSDDDWTETSIYNLWMRAEEVADDEEAFDEWYEESDVNKILSHDEARILMIALCESYDYLELELKRDVLNHKIKRKVNKDEYEFISRILPYGIEDWESYKKR